MRGDGESWDSSAWRTEWGISMCKWGGTKRMDPGAIQWGPVTGSEVTGNTETQEAPSEHQEPFFYCEGD